MEFGKRSVMIKCQQWCKLRYTNSTLGKGDQTEQNSENVHLINKRQVIGQALLSFLRNASDFFVVGQPPNIAATCDLKGLQIVDCYVLPSLHPGQIWRLTNASPLHSKRFLRCLAHCSRNDCFHVRIGYDLWKQYTFLRKIYGIARNDGFKTLRSW